MLLNAELQDRFMALARVSPGSQALYNVTASFGATLFCIDAVDDNYCLAYFVALLRRA
ncbi:MAG TPA: hypothetical protein VKM55_25285 [Candidatus Lokiarchaeia archaeon]|nr:hypothetical protein [Candidatus Lokiarchaeia archaeon]